MAIRVFVRLLAAMLLIRCAGGQAHTISIMELAHKVPRAAMQEAERADKAFETGDFRSMIAHLEQAVAIDPGFIAAQKNLALAYGRTGEWEKAIQAFERLAELTPRSAIVYAGLSATYYNLRRFEDAEIAARRAVALSRSNGLAHFLLGTALAAQDKDRTEALEHLRLADREYPMAYLIASGILAREGNRQEARIQLQAYFDSGDTSSIGKAEELSALLQIGEDSARAATR